MRGAAERLAERVGLILKAAEQIGEVVLYLSLILFS